MRIVTWSSGGNMATMELILPLSPRKSHRAYKHFLLTFSNTFRNKRLLKYFDWPNKLIFLFVTKACKIWASAKCVECYSIK